MGVGELLPRLSILTLAGGLFLLHFPGGYPRLTLSAILPCGARTFLTTAPFGILLRGRPTKRRSHYITVSLVMSITVLFVPRFLFGLSRSRFLPR